ncbi:MAG: hypothetical protein ACK5VH_09185, partial [bacterium]
MFKSTPHQDPGTEKLKRRLAVSVNPADRDAAMVYLHLGVQWLRTEGAADQATLRMEQYCGVLQEDPAALQAFSHAVSICLKDADLFPMLTESGIVLSRSLGKELTRRIKHKMIPPLRSPGDFRDVIDAIFPGRDDFRWVEAIGEEGWSRLFGMLGFEMSADESLPRRQVRQ